MVVGFAAVVGTGKTAFLGAAIAVCGRVGTESFFAVGGASVSLSDVFETWGTGA